MATILIYGVGAIGGLVGARLALAGHDVRLIARPVLAAAVAEHGLRLSVPAGGERVVREGVSTHTDLAHALAAGPAELVVLAVKAYDTASALADFRAAGDALPLVLSLQNGVGNEAELADGLGPARVLAGTITQPVSVLGPGQIVLERAKGGIGLAALVPAQVPAVAHWQSIFTQAGIPTTIYADAQAMKWSKLLMNMLANAIAALTGLTSAAVMADAPLFALEHRALREAIAVMDALPVQAVRVPGYNVPLLVAGARWLPRPLLRRVLTPMVGGGRGRKPPSLQLDIGRGKSEVGWLNGAVVRAGAALGVPTPVNAVVTEALTRLVAAGAPAGPTPDTAGWARARAALLQAVQERRA